MSTSICIRLFAVVLIMLSNRDGTITAQQRRSRAEPTAQVEFYVGDGGARAPQYRMRSFHRVGRSNVELAHKFHGLSIDGIEPAEYEYDLTPEDGRTYPSGDYELLGKLELYAPTNWITLQAPDPVGPDFGQLYVTGKITQFPKGGYPLWIRLQNVLQAKQVLQGKINPDGSFRVPCGLLFGNFVVTVCRGNEVLYIDNVRFPRTSTYTLNIDLSQSRKH
jgi:hypothetical protein